MRSRSNLKVDLGVLGIYLGGSTIGCYHLKPIFHGEMQMRPVCGKVQHFKMATISRPLQIFQNRPFPTWPCLLCTIWSANCMPECFGLCRNVAEPPFMKFISLVCSAWLTSIIYVPYHAKTCMIYFVKPLCCTTDSFWDITVWNFENIDFKQTCDLEK